MDQTTLEKALAENGRVLEVPVGHSMKPMLRHRRDSIVIALPDGEPRRNDVILFKGAGGGYILHRVIKKTPDGYKTRGDNCVRSDGVVPKDGVIGALEGFYKGDKYYDCKKSKKYRAYVAYIRASYLPRCAAKGVRAALSKVKKLISGKK